LLSRSTCRTCTCTCYRISMPTTACSWLPWLSSMQFLTGDGSKRIFLKC